MIYSNALFNAILRTDINSFIHKVFNTINPGIVYKHNWHINLVAEYLQALQKRDITRLIINIPPRSLKSVCISVAWPAWLLGQDPTARIIAASYSNMLSIKNSMDCKLVIESDWYKNLFPRTILSKKHNQKSKFLTTENGFRFATSIGGSITGEGGDYLIIDDPHNPSHINSLKLRNKVIDWFEKTFITRLNDKETGIIVLVMQRLHHEDLTGYLLNNDSNWHLLKIPIISDDDMSFNINNKMFFFPKDQSLHQTRDTKEHIQKLKLEIGQDTFNAQYMQEPISEQMSLLNIEDIIFYDEMPKKFDYILHSWDTAIKVSENTDYSVCTCYKIVGNTYYLTHLFREKLTYPNLKKQIINFINKDKPRFILIEDKASGQQVIQDLRFDGITSIVPIKPKLDKITRFASIVPLFQAGRILLPKYASFNNILLYELVNFPNHKHDDIIDSISQCMNFAKSKNIYDNARIRTL